MKKNMSLDKIGEANLTILYHSYLEL